jgi:RNA polymerase sigma factor (sigma-70 family)
VSAGANPQFRTTHWSLVLAAGAGASESAHEALAVLCETYWYPLYAYLRRRGHPAEDAQDLTQAFFAQLLERNALRHADPGRGQFRSFLLAALKNFVLNERDRRRALKRGGGMPLASLDIGGAEGRFQREPADMETPERLFDRAWAVTVLDRAVGRLRAEVAKAGKEQQFERLKIYLTGEQPQASYAELAGELGATESGIKVTVHRLRRRLRDLIRGEIAQTVASPQEVDDELRYLVSAVR